MKAAGFIAGIVGGYLVASLAWLAWELWTSTEEAFDT